MLEHQVDEEIPVVAQPRAAVDLDRRDATQGRDGIVRRQDRPGAQRVLQRLVRERRDLWLVGQNAGLDQALPRRLGGDTRRRGQVFQLGDLRRRPAADSQGQREVAQKGTEVGRGLALPARLPGGRLVLGRGQERQRLKDL